jgi:CrcB protein
MSPPAWVAFVLAAAAGAVLRYLDDGALSARAPGPFPWGTFVVNVSGSLLLGVLAGLSLYHAFPQSPRVVLGTGFCGAYTTFSTFTVDTVRLLEEGNLRDALRNAFGTLVVATLAAGAGLALAAAL